MSGRVDGELNDATRAAERMFGKLSSIKIPDALTLDTVKTLSGVSRQICPLVCPGGVRTAGGRCISRTVASDKAARSNAAKPKSKHRETRPFPSERQLSQSSVPSDLQAQARHDCDDNTARCLSQRLRFYGSHRILLRARANLFSCG